MPVVTAENLAEPMRLFNLKKAHGKTKVAVTGVLVGEGGGGEGGEEGRRR